MHRRALLQCGRLWVRAPKEPNQTIKLVFVASLIVVLMPAQQFSAISWREQVNFQ
jgi:hypothetical protein